MACYHLTLKHMSRKAGAHSAAHGVAYRSGSRGAAVTVGGVSGAAAIAYRAGGAIRDERTGLSYDYSHKADVKHVEIVTPSAAQIGGELPAFVRSLEALANAMEAAENRKDARIATEIEVMLPRELSHAEQLDAARKLAHEHGTKRGLVAVLAIHEHAASDGKPHPHAHILLTPRAVTPEGFAKRKDDAYRWDGRGDKSKAPLERLRADWERIQNDALEAAGSGARVSHRSLKAQRAQALGMAQEAHTGGRFTDAARHRQRAASLDRPPLPHFPREAMPRAGGRPPIGGARDAYRAARRDLRRSMLAGGARTSEATRAAYQPRPYDAGRAFDRWHEHQPGRFWEGTLERSAGHER